MVHTLHEQQPVGGGKAAAGGERDAGLDTAEQWWGTFLDRAPAQGAAAGEEAAEEGESAAEPGASTAADGRGGRGGRGASRKRPTR